MKVTSIEQTCAACPSQWEGVLDDGRNLYVRYRWGNICVYVSHEPGGDVFERDTCIYSECHGGEYDGEMSDEEMWVHLKRAGLSMEGAV